jgi:hypothetical protein
VGPNPSLGDGGTNFTLYALWSLLLTMYTESGPNSLLGDGGTNFTLYALWSLLSTVYGERKRRCGGQKCVLPAFCWALDRGERKGFLLHRSPL